MPQGFRAFFARNRMQKRIQAKALCRKAFRALGVDLWVVAQKPKVRHVHIFSSTFPDNHSTPSPPAVAVVLVRFSFAVASVLCGCFIPLLHHPTFSTYAFPSLPPFFITPNPAAPDASQSSTFLLLLFLSLLSLLLLSLLCYCSFNFAAAFVFLLLSLSP